MQNTHIAITAIGMVTAVGLNAIQSCAAIRAGISGYREWEQYGCVHADGTPEPLVCACVPVADGVFDRVIQLSLMSMQEVIQSAGLTRVQLADSAVFMSLPPRYSSKEQNNAVERVEEIMALLGKVGIDLRSGLSILKGHAGALMALHTAAQMLIRGTKERCIIVGADSYLAPLVLKGFDAQARLKSSLVTDAFVPGEGAAALVLETCEHAKARKAPILAVFDAVGTGAEVKTIGSGDPSTGTGLCQAVESALAKTPSEQVIQWVVCDLNGESYRAREWGHCLVRLQGRLKDIRWTWHPADCIGDVGAASAAMLTAIIARAFERGYAPVERALLWASSDDGDRAAVVLRAASEID